MKDEIKELERQIEAQERRIAKLESQRHEAEALRLSLIERLQTQNQVEATVASGISAAEKVLLFRSLFRGRDDVYPKLWENPKQNKKGYAPACDREWVRGVCEKPRVKCGACPNQAFTSVSDQTILDHLQGRHTVGVYPLLPDETCWFLAVDFDKKSWGSDTVAFLQTCRDLEVPAALERSRSGNGAHVWFFFDSPVKAATARNMGSYLLTETMARHHQLSMDSYDRLFPNQDVLPKGGFGNLIALPLQYGPRQAGNSVFVDDGFISFPDQWEYLSTIKRISPLIADRIVQDAARTGKIFNVGWAHSLVAEDEAAPWVLPSSKPARSKVSFALPDTVPIILAQRIFIEKNGLPSAFLNEIKKLASFQNPEFYKKQNLRLSTNRVPRIITCSEELPQHMALPRGCLEPLLHLFDEAGIKPVIDDKREVGENFSTKFGGTLTPTQQEALNALLGHDMGILCAPPGLGKTVLGAALVAARSTSALILVHRKPLLDQWIAQLALFLNLNPKSIGQIASGKNKPTGMLDVAMLQTLTRTEKLELPKYGQVIIDECHHLPALSREKRSAGLRLCRCTDSRP